MNAIEIADMLAGTSGDFIEAAEMLRRQHEAIVRLREALRFLHEREWQDDDGHPLLSQAREQTEQALADTENLK